MATNSTKPLNIKYGAKQDLPTTTLTDGTLYVATKNDNRAELHVGLNGTNYVISESLPVDNDWIETAGKGNNPVRKSLIKAEFDDHASQLESLSTELAELQQTVEDDYLKNNGDGSFNGNLTITGSLTVNSANGITATTFNGNATSATTAGTLSSVLPVSLGGTGITSNPSMLINLASTSADTVFEASPRPGVTGTLPIANGGTGATTAQTARTNLGAFATSGGTITGSTTFNSVVNVKGGNIEIFGTSAVATPYIDFHYGETTTDYTSRIIESASGELTINNAKISNGKVWGAVWNDYAEFFPRGEKTEAGDIIALDLNSDNEVYVKATKDNKAVVGVESNEYGHILGGDDCSIEENMKNYIPVGLAGRVWVKVQGNPKKGDYIGASDIPGVGEVCDDKYNAIGICVDNNLKDGKCRIKII